jgi:hypothetical protein
MNTAFERLRRWMSERPHDPEALEHWRRLELELGRIEVDDAADEPLARDTDAAEQPVLTGTELRVL